MCVAVATLVGVVGCAVQPPADVNGPNRPMSKPSRPDSHTSAAPSPSVSAPSVASVSAQTSASQSAESTPPESQPPAPESKPPVPESKPPAPESKPPAPPAAESADPAPPAAGSNLPAFSTTSDVDCSKVKCVALTYDDGPSEYTGRLLDTLKAYNARATFFHIAPHSETYSKFVKREVDEGHEIGNHTVNHPELTKLSEARAAQEIAQGQARIERVAGRKITLLRPPYGDRNATTDALAGTYGQAVVTWSVDTLDWKYRNAQTVTNNVVRNVFPNSVVLMHDIHKTTVDAAGPILAALKKQGYHFVTVSQLKGATKPGVVYS